MPARTMSFFPSACVSSAPEISFHPLFRLLDDFEGYSRGGSPRGCKGTQRACARRTPTFAPRFDVTERADAYELHGEFPGVAQEHVEVTFTDAHTLRVKGRVERNNAADKTEGAAETTSAEVEADGASLSATVEEDFETVEKDEGEKNDSVDAASHVESPNQQSKPEHPVQGERAKYWVSERSVGDFSRSFTFPARVDQDAVRASMSNGVLSIVVPKSKKESRKIQIA